MGKWAHNLKKKKRTAACFFSFFSHFRSHNLGARGSGGGLPPNHSQTSGKCCTCREKAIWWNQIGSSNQCVYVCALTHQLLEAMCDGNDFFFFQHKMKTHTHKCSYCGDLFFCSSFLMFNVWLHRILLSSDYKVAWKMFKKKKKKKVNSMTKKPIHFRKSEFLEN